MDYGWLMDNRNKRGLVLDLKTEAGREALYRLIRDTDVFVTNLPLAARERLGIGYDDLAAHNERLIYASLTAYGERGPERFNTGFDSTALWARSGLMDMVRPAPDSPPAKSLPGMGDHPTAITLYAAIATALFRRERTGRGGYVATNLMANGLWWNALHAQAMLCGAEFARRPGREDAPSALHNFYRTEPTGAGSSSSSSPRTSAGRGSPVRSGARTLIENPRFAHPGEAAREPACAHPRARRGVRGGPISPSGARRLDEHGVSYGVISTLRDIPEDRQMLESGALTALDDPEAGAKYVVSSPLWVDGAPAGEPVASARIGEHSVENPARATASRRRTSSDCARPGRSRTVRRHRSDRRPPRSPSPLERGRMAGPPRTHRAHIEAPVAQTDRADAS